MKNRIFLAVAIIGLLATSCKKENPEPQQAELMQSYITINATYKTDNGAKVDYTENGNAITATWESGDQILVAYDGHVSTLTLQSGAGTSSATFSGEITYTNTPTTNSVLSCYVRDAKNQAALTIDGDNIVYSDAAFLAQNGTVAGAGKCNTYMGMATYGDGTNITCTFSVNTSIMKFIITNIGNDANNPATLSYVSGTTTVAQASFTVASGTNTVYLAVPAGSYSGEQKLIYTCNANTKDYTLGSNATFAAGQTYSKEFGFLTITNLSTITSNYTAQDNEVLTGTLNSNVKISIAENANVILRGITINGVNSWQYEWAGLTCLGDAKIILEDGTTNNVTGFDEDYPGIYVPSGKTLTIEGNGTLNVSSNEDGEYAAAIGSGEEACGNIIINGGTINATGVTGIGAGKSACGFIRITGGNITATATNYAGIGAGNWDGPCGDITITGGTIHAENTSTSHENSYGGAGIGGGMKNCGNISIQGGTITAIGGPNAAGIGSGGWNNGTCASISITGGTVYATGGDSGAGIGQGYSEVSCGVITIGSGITRIEATRVRDNTDCIGGCRWNQGSVTVNIASGLYDSGEGNDTRVISADFPPVTWEGEDCWDIIRVDDDGSYCIYKGITVTASGDNASFSNGTIFIQDDDSNLTFSPASGQSFNTISRIEITAEDSYSIEIWGILSDGWTQSDNKLIWTGDPSASVTLTSTAGCNVNWISKIEFTVQSVQ